MSSGETLKKQLANAGIDVKTFDKVEIEGLDEEEEFEDDSCEEDDDDDDDEEEDDGDDDETEEGQNESSSGSNGGLYVITVAAKNALTVWGKARSILDTTGYWPIISDDVEQLLECFELDLFEEDVLDTDQIVRLSESIDPESWLCEQYKKNLEYYTTDVGDWPAGVQPDTSYAPAMVQGDGIVSILFCSASEAWHVPAAIRWGGSNDGMLPQYHTAFLKRWNKEYGAELVCANMSTIEMKVSKPPQTKADALALAKEQFAYCPDIVTQRRAPQTVAALAADLYKSPQWYFWWD